MHFQLYKEDIYRFLKEDEAFEAYSMEQLVQDLEALVKWKILHRYRIRAKCTQ